MMSRRAHPHRKIQANLRYSTLQAVSRLLAYGSLVFRSRVINCLDHFRSRRRELLFRGWTDGLALAHGMKQGICGGNRTKYVEQRGIGGNMQVEVYGAVNEDAGESQDAGQGHGASHLRRPVPNFSKR